MRDKIKWCKKQKRGIEFIESNENISRAYLKKAHNSLRAMNLNYDEKILDWAVDAAYYARYQTIYSLFQKLGVKCEIHDCSISLFSFLFKDIFEESLFKEIEEAKKQRINLTYYTDRLVPKEDIKINIDTASTFVITVEDYVTNLDSSTMEKIKEKLRTTLGE